MGDRHWRSDINEISIGMSIWVTGYRFGIPYIDMVIYRIDMVILDIDMGYRLMIWEMTVTIRSSSISIWDILSLRVCERPHLGLLGVVHGQHVVLLVQLELPVLRGLHSSIFRLNVNAFYGIGGACRGRYKGCLGGVREYQGVCRVCFVSETAQVELRSGRV